MSVGVRQAENGGGISSSHHLFFFTLSDIAEHLTVDARFLFDFDRFCIIIFVCEVGDNRWWRKAICLHVIPPCLA